MSFFLFISSFFCNLFLNFFFTQKNYYTKIKEKMFQYSNYNIVLFFYYVKNELEILLVFINEYDLYYI